MIRQKTWIDAWVTFSWTSCFAFCRLLYLFSASPCVTFKPAFIPFLSRSTIGERLPCFADERHWNSPSVPPPLPMLSSCAINRDFAFKGGDGWNGRLQDRRRKKETLRWQRTVWGTWRCRAYQYFRGHHWTLPALGTRHGQVGRPLLPLIYHQTNQTFNTRSTLSYGQKQPLIRCPCIFSVGGGCFRKSC